MPVDSYYVEPARMVLDPMIPREGLDWFEPGESLVLINDYDQPATAVVLDVNPWPSSDSSVACDAPLGRG